MFLFVGIVMAVLQGGVVRRIPQGKEKKAAMGWVQVEGMWLINNLSIFQRIVIDSA